MDPDGTIRRGSHKALVVARWIVVLPCAVVGGVAASMLLTFINRVTKSRQGIDPNGFFGRIYVDGVGRAAMGIVIVYLGAKIAPHNKDPVAVVLSGFVRVSAGFLLYPVVLARDWWATYSGLALVLGAGSVAWKLYTGEASEIDS